MVSQLLDVHAVTGRAKRVGPVEVVRVLQPEGDGHGHPLAMHVRLLFGECEGDVLKLAGRLKERRPGQAVDSLELCSCLGIRVLDRHHRRQLTIESLAGRLRPEYSEGACAYSVRLSVQPRLADLDAACGLDRDGLELGRILDVGVPVCEHGPQLTAELLANT